MAFGKKKSKLGKNVVFTILIFFIVVGVAAGGFWLYMKHINDIKTAYETQITDMQMKMYNDKRQAYIPKKQIGFGDQLTEELFDVLEVSSSIDKSLFMTKEDVGRYAMAEMMPGMPVMKYMIADEEIQNDVRQEEFNMFMLQSKLLMGEFIDLRIMYPNGEDYIVFSKKKIRDINLGQNTIWCWLNEKEILTVSSAMVDAYVHKGTKLYVLTYVAPASQEESIPTYPVNLDVMRLMAADPNILDRSKVYLAQQARIALDLRIKAIPADVSSSVQSEVTKEASGVQGTIQTDAITNGVEESQQPTTPPVTNPPTTNTGDGAVTPESTEEGDDGGFYN